MQKKLLYVLTFILISLGVCGISHAGLNDGIVAYWSFENCDAIDDSGNEHNGTIYSTPECVDGIKGNRALKFNGSDWIKIAQTNLIQSESVIKDFFFSTVSLFLFYKNNDFFSLI